MMRLRALILSVALGVLLSAGVVCILNGNAVAAETLAAPDVESSGIQTTEAISTAYLVFRFSDHDSIVRAITFTEPISSQQALEMSGLTVGIAPGGFLCNIEGVGTPITDCFSGDRYWWTASWNANSGTWDGRMVGIADATIEEDGHVEGYSWSDPGFVSVDPPPAPTLVAADRALAWLRTQQRAGGAFPDLFNPAGATAEALMALGANRLDARDWVSADGTSALAAMWALSRDLSSDAAGAGKLAVALSPQASCWLYGAAQPTYYYSPTTGGYDAGAGAHAWAMLGTAALSQTIPTSATTYLLDLQQANGGWEWSPSWGVDSNATALALQALVAAGEAPSATAVISGVAYLEQLQNADGGFPYNPDFGSESDTNSTAYVVQALLAAGEDPITGTWTTISDTNPIEYLIGMQLANGALEFQPGQGADWFATRQAATALLYRPLPVRVEAQSPCNVVFCSLSAR